MVDYYSLNIPGASPGDTRLPVTSPFNEELLAECQLADEQTVEQALTNAAQLFSDRSAYLPLPQRLEILQKTADIMEQQAENLALSAAREGGKPLIDSRIEVARAIDGVRLCVETMRTQTGEVIPMGINPASMKKLAFTRKEPIGVVVAVSAFNHPLNLIVHQVAPAIATGCPVIVKPAKKTPISCFRFAKILEEAGLPAGWCQVLTIGASSLSTKLVTDPRVAFFSFIGSAGVGWMLRSKLAPGTRCALEHGGVAPVIVAEDAELETLLPKLTKAGFYHGGQVCVSVQRVYAHRSIARELAEKLAEQAIKLVVGDPAEETTEVGPLIDPAEVDRVTEWVDEAVELGGELLCGGKPLSKTCYSCTVLFDPPDSARVSREEVFGPVVCIYPFDELDEAINRANSLDFAFQAAAFTRDIDTAMELFDRLDGSAIMVNEHTAFRVDWMPFAGLKKSGHGTGGIPHTISDMQVEKMLVLHSEKL